LKFKGTIKKEKTGSKGISDFFKKEEWYVKFDNIVVEIPEGY